MLGACFGLLDVDNTGSVHPDDNFVAYWVSWDLLVRGSIGPALGLAGIVGRLDALTTLATPFAEPHWDFEGGVVEDCSGICSLTWMAQRATFKWRLKGS